MSDPFYSDARSYDLLFAGGDDAVEFYRAEAERQGGSVLELGSGTYERPVLPALTCL